MIYRFEDCELNTDIYTFSNAGESQRLEPKVFDLLIYLIEHRDRVVSKDELLEQLWPDANVSEATLNSSIMTARRAVGDSGSQQRVIKTLRSRGYRFMLEVDEAIVPPLPPSPTARICESCRQDVPQPAMFCPTCGWRLTGSGISDTSDDIPPHPPRELVRPPLDPVRITSERKPVTALSCALDDTARHLATSAPDTFHGIIRQLFELALPEVERYDGTITQFLEDGFFALFGASTVHEDHPRRAVLAALAVQRQFKLHIGQHAPSGADGRPLTIRMGLHTGRVLVCRVGDAVHLTSTAIEGMNDRAIACQQQALPDAILVSEAVRSHVRDIVRLESAGAIKNMPGGEQTYQVMVYQWR